MAQERPRPGRRADRPCSSEDPALNAKRHIIVIDDDASVLDAVSRLLVRLGYEVTGAPAGAEGLRLWREQGADLVLTDLQMPGMNGLELILQLRAYAPDLPVIAMSGADRSRDLDLPGSAGLLGAVGLLAKPFGGDELIAAIAAAHTARRAPGA